MVVSVVSLAGRGRDVIGGNVATTLWPPGCHERRFAHLVSRLSAVNTAVVLYCARTPASKELVVVTSAALALHDEKMH